MKVKNIVVQVYRLWIFQPFCFASVEAEIVIWDFETRQQYCKLVLHRNSVEAVAFTHNDKYLITLGGQDDGRYDV